MSALHSLRTFYVNAIHPRDPIVDGVQPIIGGQKIREDLTIPVMKVLSEVEFPTGQTTNRQPDTDRLHGRCTIGRCHKECNVQDSGSIAGALHQRRCETAESGTRRKVDYRHAGGLDRYSDRRNRSGSGNAVTARTRVSNAAQANAPATEVTEPGCVRGAVRTIQEPCGGPPVISSSPVSRHTLSPAASHRSVPPGAFTSAAQTSRLGSRW